MEYKIFDNLPQEAKDIRTAVFVDEQGFKNEFDEIDDSAKHILIYHDGKAVGVARFFSEDGKEYHIGRVAVLEPYRKYGYGKEIIFAIENELKKTNAERISLSAQTRVSGFYEKCGYKKVGGEYFDEFCPHIAMIKKL